jgi:CheY-like chemotaxis protein
VATILVVDDDRAVRKVIREFLERDGHQVVEATDGAEAIEAYSADKIDLMVLDLLMPNRDGFEALIDVRHRHPQARVVVISGGGQLGADLYLKMASQFGATEVLAKPIERDALLAKVHELLSQEG